MGKKQHLSDRLKTLKKQAKECCYCKQPYDRTDPQRSPTVDHRVARAQGGPNHHTNVLICCRACNEEKGALTDVEYFLFRDVTSHVTSRQGRQKVWREWLSAHMGH